MKATVGQKLLIPFITSCLSICPQFVLADDCDVMNLQYSFWTSYEEMVGPRIRGTLWVTLSWSTPPDVDVWYYFTYRNGSRSPTISKNSFTWRLFGGTYEGPNRIEEFEMAAQEVLSSSHSFEVQAVVYNGEDVFCSADYIAPPPEASEPEPADGSIAGERAMILYWRAGSYAVSHDIYFGESFVDVNEGTGGTFRCNQAANQIAIGLGNSIQPDGLAPAKTYYWRVDEVRKNGEKIRGDVWSFTLPGLTAYAPVPAEGSKFLDTNLELVWLPGFGAYQHDVYCGTDPERVGNADVQDSSGIFLGRWPDPNCWVYGLEKGRTYYWRVDEVEADGQTLHKGDVWAFATAGSGGGVRGDYFKGTDLSNHVLSRIDPRIDFDLGMKGPDQALGSNDFSVIWTAEFEAVFSETYTFHTRSDDGVRLWINGRSIVDNWSDHSITENKGTIDLVAGKRHILKMWWYDRQGEALAQLLWEGPRTPKRIVPQAAFSLPVHARYPSPVDGGACGRGELVLKWVAGEEAFEHDVYLGTDLNVVSEADRFDSSGIYCGRQTETSFDAGQPTSGSYYWRIDEVQADGATISKGDIWSFTIADVEEEKVEYQVSSGDDDGYASRDDLDRLGSSYLRLGISAFTELPYYSSAMVFRGVEIPQGTAIISARLKVRAHNSYLTDTVYSKIEAEDTDNAAVDEGPNAIGATPTTGASVDWVLSEPWLPGVWYDSPDIADLIRDIVNRPGWSAGNSLAIICSSWWSRGGNRRFSSYEHGSGYAPKLEIIYIPR